MTSHQPSDRTSRPRPFWVVAVGAFALLNVGLLLVGTLVLLGCHYQFGELSRLPALVSWGIIVLGMNVSLACVAWGSRTAQAATWSLLAMLPRMLPALVGLAALPNVLPHWRELGGGEALLICYLAGLTLEVSISVLFFAPASGTGSIANQLASPVSREA